MGAEFDAQARDAEAEVEAEHEQLVAQVCGEGCLGAVTEGGYVQACDQIQTSDDFESLLDMIQA